MSVGFGASGEKDSNHGCYGACSYPESKYLTAYYRYVVAEYRRCKHTMVCIGSGSKVELRMWRILEKELPPLLARGLASAGGLVEVNPHTKSRNPKPKPLGFSV